MRHAADPQLNLANVHVHVSQRRVRIEGVVPTDDEHLQLVEVIRGVPGVASVSDELNVATATRQA
jgi:osmotically-inducible protein OsmY